MFWPSLAWKLGLWPGPSREPEWGVEHELVWVFGVSNGVVTGETEAVDQPFALTLMRRGVKNFYLLDHKVPWATINATRLGRLSTRACLCRQISRALRVCLVLDYMHLNSFTRFQPLRNMYLLLNFRLIFHTIGITDFVYVFDCIKSSA